MGLITATERKSTKSFLMYFITSIALVYLLWNGPLSNMFEQFGLWIEANAYNTLLWPVVLMLGGGIRAGMTIVALGIVMFIIISPNAHLPKGGEIK